MRRFLSTATAWRGSTPPVPECGELLCMGEAERRLGNPSGIHVHQPLRERRSRTRADVVFPIMRRWFGFLSRIIGQTC